MCVCVFWCVQGLFLSMPVIVPVCGSFYQPGTIHRWENVTNYHTGISHKHTCWFKVSPENLYMCCNTHTHTHTRWFKVSPENLYMCCNTHTHTHTHTRIHARSCSDVQIQLDVCIYSKKNHLHHVKPALLRKMNIDKRQTANYREEILLLITNKHVWKRLKDQIWPNTNESVKKVCLVCVNIPGFCEFL